MNWSYCILFLAVGVAAGVMVAVVEEWGAKNPPRRVEMRRDNERSEAELSECFLMAKGNPAFEAVLEVIDNEVLRVGNQMTDEAATDRQLYRWAGCQQTLLDLKATLLDKVEAASLSAAQAREEGNK